MPGDGGIAVRKNLGTLNGLMEQSPFTTWTTNSESNKIHLFKAVEYLDLFVVELSIP